MSLRLEPRVSHLQQLGFAHCFGNYNFKNNARKMKRPNHHEDLIRTDITVLSLLDPITHIERVLSARCVGRCNIISHCESLFEKHMSEFVEQNHTIEHMAELCNMSVTVFKKKFAEYYQLPPHRWFVKQRLIMAAEMFLTEDFSIKEVCHKCYFSNYSHFTNRFKREFGMTPKQYIERYK